MRHLIHLSLLLFLGLGIAIPSSAQVLDFMNKVSIVLDDGTNVVLHGATSPMNQNFSGEYYYLPTGLRLSHKPDQTPEFLFLKYTSEERTDAGGVNGALLHFLMKWGLTPDQETELQSKLVAKVQDLSKSNPKFRKVINPRVMGAANLKTDPEDSFQIISAVLKDQKSTPTLVTSGRAPLMPGGKVAVAAKMEKNAAQLISASLEENRSITDLSVSLRFQYDVLMPAVEGKITVNWLRVDSVYQSFKRTATHEDGGSKGSGDDTVTDTELDTLFSVMRQSKAVEIQLDVLQPESQIAQEMVSAFMEYFLRSVSEKEFQKTPKDDNDSRADQDNYKYAYRNYKIDRQRLEQKMQRRTETYNMKVRLPITQEYTITENLATWYDAVRDNQNCVNTINLNDPFFDHRDIYLILDLDAEEMFGKEMNFVTVDIRKRRDEADANDFSKQVTFDKRFFKENGNRAVVTYSRAEDTLPDDFEYKVQWSLRGGNVYPADTSWTRGSWEGVTLAPPVIPTPIRFEADLQDLKELNIVNASLQLRYYKFGQEVQTSYNINTSSDIGYLEKNIFMDRNTSGYAYRLVFFHKTKGQLATEWDAHLNTGYMYAVVPKALRNNDQKFIEKMIDLGKEVIRTPEGKKIDAGAVLDQFKDLIITN